MKNLTKKSLIVSTTIAGIIAMVVALLSKAYGLSLIFFIVNFLIIGFAHFFIDNRIR